MKKVFLFLILIFLIGISVVIGGEEMEVRRLRETKDVLSKDLPVVLVVSDKEVYELQLYDNEAARQLLAQLPQKLVMTRRGDGVYYAALSEKIKVSGEKTRRAYKRGEVALWIKGNALCLLFGPTPFSLTTDTPLLPSAGVALGRIKSFSGLDQLPSVAEFEIKIRK